MKGYNKSVGKDGETLAEHFLKSQGYRVVERNWRCRLGEIDLIVQKDTGLYFVEVKTRMNDCYGSPLLAIDARKQRRLRRLAEIYLASHPSKHPLAEIGLSCLGIAYNDGKPNIDWLPNAFGL